MQTKPNPCCPIFAMMRHTRPWCINMNPQDVLWALRCNAHDILQILTSFVYDCENFTITSQTGPPNNKGFSFVWHFFSWFASLKNLRALSRLHGRLLSPAKHATPGHLSGYKKAPKNLSKNKGLGPPTFLRSSVWEILPHPFSYYAVNPPLELAP